MARTRMDGNELVFLPLGGVGEIGMNLSLYGYGPADRRAWIMVDCGVSFPGPDMPGADLVLPDIRYIEEERLALEAIVVTHAHEDHYGALMALWPRLQAPVHATPFAAGMLEAKRAWRGESGEAIPVRIFRPGETFRAGPFAIEAVPVNHSIPEPVSLIIAVPAGRVIHTADWKIDATPALEPPTEENRFRKAGDAGLLALVCDSTNATREGVSPSEREVARNLAAIIAAAKGRVAVTAFSSNVGRIRSIAEAARDAGRQVLLLGSSIRRVVDVATDLGYMDGLPPFLDEEAFAKIPPDKIVIVLTGSQGEPRAVLARIARGEMRNVSLGAGDTAIFSSRSIPGNEKPIIDIQNALIDMGVEVVTDDTALVHVSGHPRRGELRRMYEWTRPEILVPVHGEAVHLDAHAEFARQCGIENVPRLRNGDVLRLAPGPAEIVATAPSGRIYKDGNLVGDHHRMGIAERRKLGHAGHIAVNVLLDGAYDLAGDPDVRAHGLPETDGNGRPLIELLAEAALDAALGVPRGQRRDLDRIRTAVGGAVRSRARRIWGKKPMTTVFVNRFAGKGR